MPTGPSVMVLPGSGKSYERFRADDAYCQQQAFDSLGLRSAATAANEAGAQSVVAGTAVGAAAGALIAGEQGAAVGAGTGLIVGSAAGAGAAGTSSYATQRRFDSIYLQCMYAKGHRIPVRGSFTSQSDRSTSIPPPPPPSDPSKPPSATRYPPPPPGSGVLP